MARRRLFRRVRIIAGVLLAFALLAMLFILFAISWRPAPDAFPAQGVDVSEAQGAVDWWAVRGEGVRFAYARATIGARGRDGRFAANWRGMYEAGIPRGAIHAFSLCRLATDQAGNFVATVGRADDQLAPAVELDFDPRCPARPARDVVLGELGRYLAAVEGFTGRRAVLKVSRAFEDRYRISAAFDRPLWSAASFFPPAYFDKPWRIWQASSFRRIRGIAGPVNWDVMRR